MESTNLSDFLIEIDAPFVFTGLGNIVVRGVRQLCFQLRVRPRPAQQIRLTTQVQKVPRQSLAMKPKALIDAREKRRTERGVVGGVLTTRIRPNQRRTTIVMWSTSQPPKNKQWIFPKNYRQQPVSQVLFQRQELYP